MLFRPVEISPHLREQGIQRNQWPTSGEMEDKAEATENGLEDF